MSDLYLVIIGFLRCYLVSNLQKLTFSPAIIFFSLQTWQVQIVLVTHIRVLHVLVSNLVLGPGSLHLRRPDHGDEFHDVVRTLT